MKGEQFSENKMPVLPASFDHSLGSIMLLNVHLALKR